MRFSASILMQSLHQGEPPGEELWEEVIVLIEAADNESAMRLAEQAGRAREHEFFVDSPHKHLLRWTFASVERVVAIEDQSLAHGAELFSRFLRREEAMSLRRPFE